MSGRRDSGFGTDTVGFSQVSLFILVTGGNYV